MVCSILRWVGVVHPNYWLVHTHDNRLPLGFFGAMVLVESMPLSTNNSMQPCDSFVTFSINHCFLERWYKNQVVEDMNAASGSSFT